MKKLNNILAISLIALSITSCKKPEACISAPTIVEVGQQATFNTCSINSDSYLWDMGDGTTITTPSANYTYNTAGLYTVSLQAKKGRKSNLTTVPIEVVNQNYKFQGNYNATDDCIGSYLTQVQTQGSNQIIVVNLANQGWNVTCNVNGSTFQILPQYAIQDSFGDYWDILSGSGSINGNTITITFTIDDTPYSNISGVTSCTGTYTK